MPGPHGLQVADEFAASAVENVPAGHFVQEMLPSSEYVPDGHALSELRLEAPEKVET